MEFVFEPAGGLVQHADQQRVAPAIVIGGVVVPADMVARARVVIERVGVRVRGRADLELVAGDLFEPMNQRGRSIELGNERRLLVDGVPADAAALLVAGQVVAVQPRLERAGQRHQFGALLGRQEFVEVEERALAVEVGAQRGRVQPGRRACHGGIGVASMARKRRGSVDGGMEPGIERGI
ncbi:hypothetical protein D3C87_1513730 [compost metagenome]